MNQSSDGSMLDALPAAPTNSSPTADAGPEQDVITGSLVVLDGSGSTDPEGDALICYWNFVRKPDGSSVELSNADTFNPSFAPDIDGLYEIEIVVSDAKSDDAKATVTINSYSDLSSFFSKTPSSSGVYINGYWQAGSKFSLSIKNNSDFTFVCTRAEFYNGSTLIAQTEDPSLLGGDQLEPEENIGVAITLSSSLPDNGFVFNFCLVYEETGNEFVITHVYENEEWPLSLDERNSFERYQ